MPPGVGRRLQGHARRRHVPRVRRDPVQQVPEAAVQRAPQVQAVYVTLLEPDIQPVDIIPYKIRST